MPHRHVWKSENGVNKLVYQNILGNYDDAYAEQVEDKVFLLDVKQIQQVFNNTPTLGLWYHIGKLTEKAVENSDYIDSRIVAGNDWHCLLRSPRAAENYDSTVRGVARNGQIISNIASADSIGVRPAFYMKEQTRLLSGSGTDADPYLLTGGHAHDLSTECGDDAPVSFAKKITSNADGNLLINGVELSLQQEDTYSYNSLPAGNYYLGADVSLNHNIEIKTGDVSLCLNGHTLNLNGCKINIARKKTDTGNFSVCDCGGGGQIVSDFSSPAMNDGMIDAHSAFYLYGGKVRNSYAGQERMSRAVVASSGTVYLYGGEVVSDRDFAVLVDYSTGSELVLSGAPKLKGNGKDIFLRNENSERIITLTGPLSVDSPYRVDADTACTFTADWDTHMSGKRFSEYFTSVKKGLFINENENGELALFNYAITQQPSPENRYTVTANGAPDYAPASYQWYPAEVTTQAVTDQNALPYNYVNDTSSYDAETGWTGTQSGECGYFKVVLSKGDIIAVKTSRKIEQGQVMLVSDDYKYQSYTSQTDADGEYILTASENGIFNLFIDGEKDTSITLTAKWTKVMLGDALDGQTGRSLSAGEEGGYLCRVSYSDGTILDSDIVHFVPQHTHSLTQVQAKAATCTEEGNKAYYTCAGCDKWFADEAAGEEITDKSSVIIAAKGHTAVADPAKAATCTETGLTEGSHCSACGHVIKAQTVTAALGHDYGEYHRDADGHWKTCRRCGETEPKEAHVYDSDTDADCNVCGYERTAENPGNVSKDVEKDEKAPDTVLSDSAEKLADIILTDEEKAQVENGTDIRFILEVKDAADTVNSSDKAAVQEALSGNTSVKGFSVGQYLDISLFKIIGTDRSAISQTSKKLTIVIDVPDSLKGKDSGKARTFAIIRVHDGVAEILEDLDTADDTITIATDRFSAYAIVYKEAGSGGDVSPSPTPDGGNTPSPIPDGDGNTPSPTPVGGNTPSPTPDDGIKPTPAPEEKPKQASGKEKRKAELHSGLKAVQTGKELHIPWGRVSGADGYSVYVQYCGKDFSAKSLNQVKSGKKTKITVKKVNGKKLDTKKNFKLYVVAWQWKDGKKKTLAKTIIIHVAGKDSVSYTNVKKIQVKKSSYTLKKGGTVTLHPKAVLYDKRKKQLSSAHCNEFRYLSSNQKVATVTAGGKVKAKGTGECTIYVFARNGCKRKIKIKVKK